MFAPIRPVIPLLMSAFFMVVGISLGHLLVPLRGYAEGWSPSLIGMLATAYALAFTAGCVFAPRFILRFGAMATFVTMFLLLGVSLVLIGYIVHPIAWVFLRSLTGFCAAMTYSLIEGWLNERSENENRGLVFSWYMVACMTGLISGQYLLPLSSPLHVTLFLVAAVCFWGAIIPVRLYETTPLQIPTSVKLEFAAIYKRAPSAVLGNFVSGILFGSWSGFAALYLSVRGFSSTGIATLLMCGTIGGLLLQFPIGRLSDFIDRRKMMMIIGLTGLLVTSGAAIWMPVAPLALGVIYFFCGATLHPSYALNVAHANDMAGHISRVNLSSTMLVIFGLGSMLGPLISGLMIDQFGFRALFVWLAQGYFIYFVFPWWHQLGKAKEKTSKPTLGEE